MTLTTLHRTYLSEFHSELREFAAGGFGNFFTVSSYCSAAFSTGPTAQVKSVPTPRSSCGIHFYAEDFWVPGHRSVGGKETWLALRPAHEYYWFRDGNQKRPLSVMSKVGVNSDSLQDH